ncbi:putative polygalacturonase [Lupinus albus]|uniref:Putative polygalacturonase n=1 Tax=Lupinus albus TaxID=3870 RepID=A0A6A4NJ18_LUPAL|nr:putative polygalacturonase [Lupinus albus]
MQGVIITFFMLSFATFYSCNARLLLDAVSNKTIFNVIEYGAVGDGLTDDSQAFLKAWNGACGKSDSVGTIEVPYGKTFLLKPLLFNGPCKFSKVYFKVKMCDTYIMIN